jgi:hypothetical protein
MVLDALRVTCLHLALLLGPLLLAACVLHQLNVLTTRVLGGTFGAGAVVWFTGWLGTPVHELSHAAACVLFRHRIQELVLFRPDPVSGVVGYVRYVWSPRNPWALLGHGLVGVAPLFGGSAVLAALLWRLAPGELVQSLFQLELAADTAAFTAQLGDWVARIGAGAASLLQPGLWTRPTTWLLAYLTLCVGTHLAPSGADLRGAWPSLTLLLALLGLVDLALVLTLEDRGTAWVLAAASLTVPVVAMLTLAALLVGAALVGVLLVATVWSTLTGRGLFTPLRMVLAEPWRLAAVAGVGLLATGLL